MRNTQWSLRKKNVWNLRGVVAGLLMVAIIVIGCGEAQAQSRCPLRFAAWMNQEDLKYYKHALGEGFTADGNVLLLQAKDSLLVFYQQGLVFLSAFDQGTERILWEPDEVNIFDLNFIPPSQLALGQLDAHAGEDILACYTYDCGTPGIGSTACWDRSLVLLLDGQTMITPIIPLSKADRIWIDASDGDPGFYSGRKWGPGSMQESQVLLFPGWEEQPLTIAVWSFIQRYEYPLKQIPETAFFQVSTYHITETQAVLTDTVEGTYAATAAVLHAAVQARRENQDAPAPIFLEFLEHGPEYCLDEHEWFELFKWAEKYVSEP